MDQKKLSKICGNLSLEGKYLFIKYNLYVNLLIYFRKDVFVKEHINRQEMIQELNSGMCTKRPMTFEVPIMLNPGEFLSVNNTANFSTDGHLDLHLQAIVESSGKDSLRDRTTQTERFHEGGIYL